MRMLSLVLVLLVAAPVAAKPVDPPAGLIATVALGPDRTFDGARAFASAIMPGAGAMVTRDQLRGALADLVGAKSLAGLDPAAWIYIAVYDDGTPGAKPHLALISKVSDAKAATAAAAPAIVAVKDRAVVIGEKDVVAKLSPYAFGTLVPSAPTTNGATVFVPALLARVNPAIADARKQFIASAAATGNPAMPQMLGSYFDGLVSLLTDSDRIEVALDLTADLGTIDLALVPHPGSRLAKFTAMQKPSDYALFDKLPASTAPMLMGGHFELGPYRDGILAVMAQMMGGGSPIDLVAVMEAIMKVTTGDIAATMTLGGPKGMTMTQLFALSDQAAAEKALVHALDALAQPKTFTLAGVQTTMRASAATTVEGVTVRGYDTTQDLSKMPAAQRATVEKMQPGGKTSVRLALFDKLGAVAMGGDSNDIVRGTIGAARGKGTHFMPAAQMAALLAASRGHKDSFAFVMDVAAVAAAFAPLPVSAGLPVALTVGCADQRAHLRFVVPATTVQAIAKLRP